MKLALILLLSAGFSFQADDIDKLKKENARLKSEIRQLQDQLRIAQNNGFLFDSKETVASLLPIIKALPKELQLKRGKQWTKNQVDDVVVLLREKVIGKRFAMKLVFKKAKITEITRDNRFGVEMFFQPDSFGVRGHSLGQLFTNNIAYGSYKFETNKDTADAIAALPVQKSIAVTGIIKSVGFSQNRFTIDLSRPIFENSIMAGH